MPKKRLPLALLICLFAICLSTNSCQKNADEQIEITGEFCTFRDGINGPVSSTITIKEDTTKNFDYLISNISGYDNTSGAFLEIGCDRVLDRLVIPEYDVTIGNSNNMKVKGEGDIAENGNISFEISLTQDSESTYRLFLNASNSNNYGVYMNTEHTLNVTESNLTFTLSKNDISYNFTIGLMENNGCDIIIPRQSIADSVTGEDYQFEGEIYYTGEMMLGSVLFSNDNWQNVEDISLELN